MAKTQRTDAYNYKVLAYRPFPVLCVIGNHEPILGRTDIPEADIGLGETVYQINPLVSYLKRGKYTTLTVSNSWYWEGRCLLTFFIVFPE